MPGPTAPLSANILALPKEEWMMLAIKAVTDAGYKANGEHVLSPRRAAGMYNVARSTLDDRMKGIRTRAEAHMHQQSLSPAEEDVLVKWAKVMGRRGVPLTYLTVAKYASEISGKSIGVSWPKRFLARHPDLKIKATTSLEKCRAKALNKAAVKGFYDILEKVVGEFGIKPENTWNMDEKGVQLGIGAKIAAIIDREQSSVYSVEDGNRELVTIIEAVSATGAALLPSVIFQGVRRNPEWGRPENNPSSASVSVSPKGWTDQELGLKWLERDFEPNTRPQDPQEFRLLILDGHNSHCTYPFIKFSAEHRILIICLPSHTTHALQPCDVGVFGPLAHAWKSQVSQASQNNVPITKSNLLCYYHNARSIALKPSTIQSAFRKTGIYPLNRNEIPESAFEPAKNTTTEAAQPLPARLPPSLVPTPNPSPAASAATTLTPNATPVTSAAPASLDHDAEPEALIDETEPGASPAAESRLRQRYHVAVPPPLPHTTSRRALREENLMLREVLKRVGMELEEDYAQMKLMDLENKQLRQKAFAKDQRKATKKKLTSGQARHMTAPEMIDLLARQTWESAMKDLFKEASNRFKAMRKGIDDYHKEIEAQKKAAEKARKAAERQAKKLEVEAEKARVQAERAATRGRGRGGHARGRGRRGGARGGQRTQGREVALATQESGSHSGEKTSDSDSTASETQNEDIPRLETTPTQPQHRQPRECRVRAPRFFVDDDNEGVPTHVIRPRPRPRPIPVRQAQGVLVPSLAHNTRAEPSGSEIASALPPKHDEMDVGGETAVVVSIDQDPEIQACIPLPTQPNPHQPSPEEPATALSRRDPSTDVEAGPSRSISSGEQNTALVGTENVLESGLQQRRSTRLSKKRN